jgi:competence protein ComEA
VRRLARALTVGAALVAAAPVAAPAEAKGKPLAPGERVDVNRAPVEELMRLPGIGRKRAETIAALRAKRPFRKVEELAQVKGISASWVAKHRAALEAGAAAPAAAAKSG